MGDLPGAIAGPPGEPSRREAVAACQAGLRREAAGLKLAYLRIADLVRELPRSDQETSWRDIGEEEGDCITMVRALALGVLTDLLGPAVRSLLAAADYQPGVAVPEAMALDAELLALPPAGAGEDGSWERGLSAGWAGPAVPESRGRDAEAPPAQIPACGFSAPGSSVTLASALSKLLQTPSVDADTP